MNRSIHHLRFKTKEELPIKSRKADEILPRNESVFSMEVEIPRLLGTEFTWADMGTKRTWL